MEYPSGMTRQPCLDLGMFVGGVIVDDGMDHLTCRNGALDLVEEANELLMAVTLHVLTDYRAIKDIEGGK